MAIINCTECGGKVSWLAASCPHCGAPVSSRDEVSAALHMEVTSDLLLLSRDVHPKDARSNRVPTVPATTNNPASVKFDSASDFSRRPLKQAPVKGDDVADGKIVSKNASRRLTSIVCCTIGLGILMYGYCQSPPHIPGSHPNSGVTWWVLVGGVIFPFEFSTWEKKKDEASKATSPK